MPSCCGLIIVSSKKQVPLRGISVDVQVKGFVADVSATLKYKNVEEQAVEAVFVFPMDEDSAVYSFEATIEGKKIIADIQEKEQAHKTYDEAISQGQQAFLLEEDKSSGDIFSCLVGNLSPGQEAEVTLSFVRELPLEADGAVRFVLPAVLNPRYTPEDQVQSLTANLPRVPIGKIPYTLNLTAHFQSAYGISKIQSNCEITPLEYTNGDKTTAKVSLAEGYKFERDVELLAYYVDVNKPSAILEAGKPDAESGSIMAEPAAMLNFYPNFPEMQEQSNKGEFIFLVDRSGSMECAMHSEPNAPKRIESAKETLVLLLKSLPLGCYFNIFGFGSHFESFFPESMEYTQQSMEEALKKVNQMDADLGGTEILQPLKKIYKTAGRPDHPRQLFVFTDGEVGNTHQVITEVQKNSHNHRCFAFGIGEGASTSLIKGISRAASGTCEFITGKDRMQPKVLRALKCSLQPIVKNISLNWSLPSGVEAVLLSKTPNAIFQGQRSIIYAQLKGKVEEGAGGEVCLEYKFKDEVFKNVLHLPFNFQKVERPTIHRLGAKALISELENGKDADSEEVKKKILATSLQSGVVSSLTAYVAVNKDSKQLVKGPPMQVDIPTAGLMNYAMPCSAFMGAPVAMACSAMPKKMMKSRMMCMASPVNFGGKMNSPPATPLCGMREPMACGKMNSPPVAHVYSGMAPLSRDQALSCRDVEPRSRSLKSYSVEKQDKETPLFKLISLQNADGSWTLSPDLSSILGVDNKAIKAKKPEPKLDDSVWATLLAIIWLHAFSLEQKDEWELLEGKAVSWIKANAGASLSKCVRAGNELLKSSVDPKVFGL